MGKIVVNNKEVSLEEFENIKNNPNFKLVEVAPNVYKTMIRLLG